MSQELQDFEYFKQHQLKSVDLLTGCLDTWGKGCRVHCNVGSNNTDGYVRVWCNKHLRMKHRLIYYLAYGIIPNKGKEIDHENSVRNDNGINNLHIVTKTVNNSKSTNRKIGRFSKETIHFICKLLETTTLADHDIAKEVGASRATVRDIKIGRSRKSISKDYSWRHRGY